MRNFEKRSSVIASTSIPLLAATLLCSFSTAGYGQNAGYGQKTGAIEVCKVSAATNPVPFDTPFTFTISPTPTDGSATQVVEAGSSANPICSPSLTITAGTVTVSESIPTNITLANVSAYTISPVTGKLVVVPVTSVGNNRVSFQLPPGGVSSETVVTFTNAIVPTGYIEICKQAAQGTTLSGDFTFNVTGGTPSSVTVAPGDCSGTIQVPAGAVTVTEQSTPGSVMTAAAAVSYETGSAAPVSVTTNLPAQTATFNIAGGNVSQQTIITFTNTAVEGQLKLCKVAGAGVTVGQTFVISANGTPYNVPAGITGTNTTEQCVIDRSFPVGSSVTVSENSPSGGAATITSSTSTSTLATCSAGAATCSAEVTIGPGVNDVTVTNTVPPVVTGQLKLCKAAGPGVTAMTMFTLTATGPSGATATYTVPAGGCALDGTFPVGSTVTVAESVPSGFAVTSIAVVSSAGASSLPNPSTGTGQVTIGTGVTEVTFTNTAVATLRVCKVVGSPNFVNTTFPISVTSGGASAGSASLTPTALSNADVRSCKRQLLRWGKRDGV